MADGGHHREQRRGGETRRDPARRIRDRTAWHAHASLALLLARQANPREVDDDGRRPPAQIDALGRARNAIKALAELAPTRAIVLRDEGGVQREVTVAIEEVRTGDRVVVKPAERIPVDGKVVEGRSGVNQASSSRSTARM